LLKTDTKPVNPYSLQKNVAEVNPATEEDSNPVF
jgi:hypothetical protein